MKILFHVGCGNIDRPSRWWGVCVHFSNLARAFEALGHNCVLQVHPQAVSDNIFHRFELSEVAKDSQCNPDVVFTWNGISPGDKATLALYPDAIKVYGELGFFDHYSTCYFDFSGTNCKSQNLIDRITAHDYSKNEFGDLIRKFSKPQLFEGRYVFVALQDELDTQITKYSPFKTMDEVMQYASDITQCHGDDIKILYKQHPMAPSNITVKDSRFIEVKEDVHHYLEDAELVIGCNSSVLFETLLYHNRVLTLGLGLSSRLVDDESRKWYVHHCYRKQINQAHLGDPEYIKNTWFYNELMEKHNAHT